MAFPQPRLRKKEAYPTIDSFSRSCSVGFIASRCCVASGQLAKNDAPFWFKVSLSLRSRSRLSRTANSDARGHINSFSAGAGWHVARSRFGVRASAVIYCHSHGPEGQEVEDVFDGCRGISAFSFSSGPFCNLMKIKKNTTGFPFVFPRRRKICHYTPSPSYQWDVAASRETSRKKQPGEVVYLVDACECSCVRNIFSFPREKCQRINNSLYLEK